MTQTTERYDPSAVDYLKVYGLLAALAVLGYLALVVWNGVVRALAATLFQGDIDQQLRLRSFVQFGYLFVGLLAFIGILACEAYLRHAITGRRRRQNDLRRRFLRLAAPMLGALVLGVVLRTVLQSL